MAAIRRFLSLLGCSLALLPGVACSGAYLQNEGPYTFTVVEVLRDDCSLLSSDGSLWDGTLSIAGKVVHMESGLMDMQLIGRFLDAGAEDNDAFTLDGSATNTVVSVGGHTCLLDQVAMHLEATTQCATQFDGVLRVRYEPQLEDTVCACQLWVSYRAVQNSSPCATLP